MPSSGSFSEQANAFSPYIVSAVGLRRTTGYFNEVVNFYFFLLWWSSLPYDDGSFSLNICSLCRRSVDGKITANFCVLDLLVPRAEDVVPRNVVRVAHDSCDLLFKKQGEGNRRCTAPYSLTFFGSSLEK